MSPRGGGHFLWATYPCRGMDLGNAEGELGARRLHHVLEVHEDALQCFSPRQRLPRHHAGVRNMHFTPQSRVKKVSILEAGLFERLVMVAKNSCRPWKDQSPFNIWKGGVTWDYDVENSIQMLPVLASSGLSSWATGLLVESSARIGHDFSSHKVFSKIVLQKSTPTEIRQRILHYY